MQSSSMAMSSDEMVAMIRLCGLNRLVQYATFVSVHIRAAQTDPAVNRALQGLRQILYTGVALNAQDALWGFENGLRLTVSRLSCILRRYLSDSRCGLLGHVWDFRNRYDDGHGQQGRSS